MIHSPLAGESDVKSVGYTFGGELVPVDQPACLAKTTTDSETGITRYWLKRATSGAEHGHLFNPHSPTFEPGGINRVSGTTGKKQYEFSKVTKACFELYMLFLLGGNTLHLRQAERELV